jgi:hypothetical protein
VLDLSQFKEIIVQPVLKRLGMYSLASERLMLGTALAESGLTYLRQRPSGPARGVYQIEPATADDLRKRFVPRLIQRGIHDVVWLLSVDAQDGLDWDLGYQTAIARLKYFSDPHPLPEANDVFGLAGYWKRVYNTPRGKGSTEHWIRVYRAHQDAL